MSFIEEFEAAASNCKLLNALLWILLSLGVIKFTTFFLSFAALLLDLILPSTSLTKYGSKKGSYALVTGASDGIGKEYATQLAARGFNLLLVSRTLSKLEALKKDLENKHHVDVKVLAMDVAKDASENYIAIKELCKDLPVTVLVNNVGQSHSIPVPFLETEEKELRDIIAINNTATLLITQTVAPIIVSSSKKLGCKGLILTMGSFGGLIPTSLLATYSGSKAFLQNWSAALSAELAKDNVDVECVLSYLVTSAMSKVRKTTFMIPNPRQFVRSTLSSVGRRTGSQSRYATTTPYWSHALFQFLIESTLGVYSKLVIKINHSLHAGIRKRALRKAARQATAAKQD